MTPSLATGFQRAWDRGEDVASCRIDFRLYGGGREGWTVQLAGVSRVSWSEAGSEGKNQKIRSQLGGNQVAR